MLTSIETRLQIFQATLIILNKACVLKSDLDKEVRQ